MQFAFNLHNHNEIGQRSLEDVISIIGAQLKALGHYPVWDPKRQQEFVMSGINVIVEGFTDYSIRTLTEARAGGARLLMIATEEPSDKGFNQGTQVEMVARQKKFCEAAPLFEGIIHLVPGEHVTKWYSQFAPSAHTELGYAPSLVRKDDRIEPDFDFGFYGSLSRRRHRLLKWLANRTGKRIKIMADFGTQAERDREMRRARVLLQIRKFDEMGLVSSSRCNTALCIGRPVVAEPHELSRPWDEVVRFSPTQDAFVSDLMITWATWRGAHAAQFAKFKEKFPPEVCIGKALAMIGLDMSERRVA